MGLQGPFPASIEFNEEEAWLLLGALARSQRLYESTFGRDDPEAKKYDKLYAKILMGCGDD